MILFIRFALLNSPAWHGTSVTHHLFGCLERVHREINVISRAIGRAGFRLATNQNEVVLEVKASVVSDGQVVADHGATGLEAQVIGVHRTILARADKVRFGHLKIVEELIEHGGWSSSDVTGHLVS
jgi:ribosomal protein L3